MATGLRELLASVVAAPARPEPAMTYRRGKHGEKVSLLGYGAMRFPTIDGGHACDWVGGDSKTGIDQDEVNREVKELLDGGVTYFDTSPAYCRGESERRLKTALAASGYRRQDYLLSSKLSNFAPSQYPAEECRRLFENTLKNLGTDYVDYYYLHSIGNGGMATFRQRYVDNGIIDWLVEQRREGRIRNLGFSYHGDPEALDWLLKRHDAGEVEWDMALIQMNYVDWHHAKEVNERNLDAAWLYQELTRRDIDVTVMEPLLGGRLAKRYGGVDAELVPLNPEATPAEWAFRFCGSHPNVLTVLSGMTLMEHVRENLRTFSPLKPLTEVEAVALERAAAAFLGCGQVPCNQCNYCMPCPYGLDIPALLAFINRVRTERIAARDELRRLYAEAVSDVRRQADRCIGCRRCVGHCPQGIDIPKVLDGIALFMEEHA